jgi:uncharacterized protein YdhG (YjbR/CyaY superfamily)
MSDNKTGPTELKVEDFLTTISDQRRSEAQELIAMMQKISGHKPVMWGPSIIGFGTKHYKYDTGREGEMLQIGFSPRKASITMYFSEGFDRYADSLAKLGKHKTSVSCLYINKLADVDIAVLRKMIEQSFALNSEEAHKISTVEEYVSAVPTQAKMKFDELRELAKTVLPNAEEVFSYGIVGYKVDEKRARVFISGWKDHVAMYPIPKQESLRTELSPYIKGKGTLWFPLDKPLPKKLIKKTMQALAE